MSEWTGDDLLRRRTLGEPLVLLAVLSAWTFEAARIPGSVRFTTIEEVEARFPRTTELVVYGDGPPSTHASWAYRLLRERGFARARHLAGGLRAWRAAGGPLERGP